MAQRPTELSKEEYDRQQQKIVDKLRAEGRMPSFDDVLREFQNAVRKVEKTSKLGARRMSGPKSGPVRIDPKDIEPAPKDSSTHADQSRRITGFNLDFRPRYWAVPEERQAREKATYAHGRTVDAMRKTAWGLRPHLRSGADLRDLRPREVEIARLQLALTVHEEVTSIRARRVGNRIAYRVNAESFDEYGGKFEIQPKTSRQPLTLGDLVRLIDGARTLIDGVRQPEFDGLVECQWDIQLKNGNSDIGKLRCWIEVSSVYYRDLAPYYDARVSQWAAEKNLLANGNRARQ